MRGTHTSQALIEKYDIQGTASTQHLISPALSLLKGAGE